MVGKKSGRALLREEGLQRTDNNMEFTAWPQVPMINQKNYYTEFLKRDDQILALRLSHDEDLDARKRAAVNIDRARAQAAAEGLPFAEPVAGLDDDVTMHDDMANDDYGSKTIVIHVGSQNMRIGLATDPLPKTVPMVIARRARRNESEDSEPKPKRQKLEQDAPSEEWFSDDWTKEYNALAQEFKTTRRSNKRRVLPNSRELVTKWNSTSPPETIPEHSDRSRVEWTELPANPKQAPDYIIGNAALRIPEQSKPQYRLHWPIRHGWLNEKDYDSRNLLEHDFFRIIEDSIKNELGLQHEREWRQHSCVFVVPDLYEKLFVGKVLDECMRGFGFQRMCFIQESIAASFGAGYGIGCVVDIGAQKTSISCIEDGMCIEDSRMNLKYGGYDVTETFIRMMLFDRLNYSDFNLMRRHDLLLAEELKLGFTTMSDENISVQFGEFFLRVYGQETRKYQFKHYDEGMLAPMGYFRPALFDHSDKLTGRHKLVPRSVDLYNTHPNDPISTAQLAVISYVNNTMPSAMIEAPSKVIRPVSLPAAATPSKHQRLLGLPDHMKADNGDTPNTSVAGSPPPDDTGTPQPGADDMNGEEPGDVKGAQPDTEVIDRTVPVMPLDQAILVSIHQASGTDERKRRDLLGSILLIGGASKTANLDAYLELRLRALLPQYPKEILVARPPRELDPAVLVWKGASVYGKLRVTNDAWISRLEYDRLGARILNYKCMWHW